MRELTWKEKVIDSQYDNAISKWGEKLEHLLEHLPKIEHLELITLKRGKQYSLNIINLSEDDSEDDIPVVEYELTSNDLPKLADKPMEVFQQILTENGIHGYEISTLNEDKLSIDITYWI